MGLFKFFEKKSDSEIVKEQKMLPWKRLTRLEQLDEIVEESQRTPVAIFKHSTTCGISRMVFRNFEQDFSIHDGQMTLYYLDIHAFREVSNETGYRFQVIHQSPQLIVVKNGTAVYNASHNGIHAADLQRFI